MSDFKISHSAIKTWKTCKELYYLSRVEKWDYKFKGASLSFGSSIDDAVSFLLRGHQEGKDLRNEVFNVFLNDDKKGWKLTFDNPTVKYREKDFDEALFSQEDKELLKKWEKELKVTLDEAYSGFKQAEHKKFVGTKKETLFNRICWLTLSIKGRLMLEHFGEEYYPKIKRVRSIQEAIEGVIELPVYGDYPTRATLRGFIDFVLDLEGYDKPIVFDLKTSASFYEEYAAKFSEQLLTYLAAVGDSLDTDLVGYIVLLKQMKMDATCGKCGAKKESSHRTCNETIKGERCKGEWIGTPKAQSQFIVNQIKKETVEEFKNGLADQAELMRLNKRIKDLDSCFKYGKAPCDMFDACHNNNYDDYTKRN